MKISALSSTDVYKFGGVAVGSAGAVRLAANHVRESETFPVVVVSAMNGVTDLLLGVARAAEKGERGRWETAASSFESRHAELIAELDMSRRLARTMIAEVNRSTAELVAMAESVSILRELTVRARDAIIARGERLLARIFADFLSDSASEAVLVDASEVIFTERRLGSLWPDFAKCERAAKRKIVPHLEKRVVVVPGFLGTGPDGELVTLGRGGSDFSAAIIGRSIHARSVTLFKEVDGLMTADPASVPSARVLAALHYREAAELAFYGAKVLHPRTMVPLIDRKIPLNIRNTFRPESRGTRIAHDVVPGDYPVRALTTIRQQALVSIDGSGMMGVPGIAGRAFTALSSAGHSVVMISQASSEASICFVLPEGEAAHAVSALEDAFASERRLKLIERIHAENGIALIAVVGLGMRGRPGIAARTFSALSGEGVNVIAIAQGSSELNITIAVAEEDAARALLALHSEFQLDRIRPLADTSGRESKLTLLGFGSIGRALAGQLISQEQQFRDRLGVDLKVIAIADRSGIKIEEKGFPAGALRKLAKKKASGGRLFDRDSPLTLAQLREMMRSELWLLPSHRPILIDITSEETAPLIQEALEQGFHVVLANKKPLTVPQIEFDRMMDTARQRGLSLRFEATAGAGLPVLDTVAKLQESGDRVESIVGCFSGTLGYLMSALEEGTPFSEAVRKAWKLGYTEPDPRDDLSGMDVARKALILARTLGFRAELSDIALEPLFGPEVDDPDPATFVSNLGALDETFSARLEKAKRAKKKLRYVAGITARAIRVGIEAVPEGSSLGRLHGTDNQVVIRSKRYRENPLIVTGPGAGAEVTAAGVLNDILAITVQEKRKRR